MKKHGVSVALAAGLLAGGLSVSSASAADLGGNCCADLEERVAELEATTARKGNRKVSLTVSGWVAEQVTYWDDGVESNVYVSGIGVTLSSHFKMTGSAQITPGWQAGYVVHVETNSNDPTAFNQNTDDGGAGVTILQSYWFLKSDQLGKLSVGKLSHASDNVAILVDGSGSLVPANWVIFDGLGFAQRSGGLTFSGSAGAPVAGDLIWGEIGFCHHIGAGIAADCNGIPQNAVRYDSPTFGGFSVSASWGEDDFWDVAARYAGEFNGVKIAVAGAWSHYSEGLGDLTNGHDSDYFQVGAYIQHVPTGLFVYGAYGYEENNHLTAASLAGGGLAASAGGFAIPDGEHFYLKAGIRQRWSPLGHTVIYGEYAQHTDMVSQRLINNGFNSSELERWGVGIVQEIDAAAMSMWLSYRHHEGELSDGTIPGTFNVDEFHIVKFGALINF
ncbi:MAG: porin [Hyphomicrobiaceae bacterium]|nr:porin [Hyphomicrobiaceae bacterium]